MRQFCFTDSFSPASGVAVRYRVSREYRLVPAPDFSDVVVAGFGSQQVPLYGPWIVESAPPGQSEYLVTSLHSEAFRALFWAFRGAGMTVGEADTAAAFAKWRHEEYFVEPMVLEEEAPAPKRGSSWELTLAFGLLLLAALIYVVVFYFFL